MDNPEKALQILKSFSEAAKKAVKELKPQYEESMSMLESDEDAKKLFSRDRIREMISTGDSSHIMDALRELNPIKEKKKKNADKNKGKKQSDTKGASERL